LNTQKLTLFKSEVHVLKSYTTILNARCVNGPKRYKDDETTNDPYGLVCPFKPFRYRCTYKQPYVL